MKGCAPHLFCFVSCSFFGQQDGDFSLVIKSIQATSRPSGTLAPAPASQRGLDRQRGPENNEEDEDEDPDLQKHTEAAASGSRRHSRSNLATRGSPWWRGVFCGLL